MVDAKHDPRQNLPRTDKEKTLKRRKGIKLVDEQKQRVQSAARALIDAYLASKAVEPGEKGRLYASLLEGGDNALIYHKPMALERQLKKHKDESIRHLVAELERARNQLHHVADVHFPHSRPRNQDLLWAFLSVLGGFFIAPLVSVHPFLLLVLVAPPVFFIGRKIWRSFNGMPPRDFSLNADGVSAKEYEDVVNETGVAGFSPSRASSHTPPEFTASQATALSFMKQNRSFFEGMHGPEGKMAIFQAFYAEKGAEGVLKTFFEALGPCVFEAEGGVSEEGRAFQAGDYDTAVKDPKIERFILTHKNDAVIKMWKEKNGEAYLHKHFTPTSSGDGNGWGVSRSSNFRAE
ncbi:MAG: hypothetical protein K0U37_07125 [Gammaproteobacteria bacterium]|nr:hypothetical protein [Gammaproteobacteria bacterium]